jgi:thiol-disulfide isomerase/thioredoxin
MGNTIAKKLDLLVSIAIIAVAILIGIVLVKNYIFNSKPKSDDGIAANNQIKIGTTISLPDINWTENGYTLLLAISSTCHFCSESAPFYQRLSEQRRNFQFIAVSHETVGESQKYLNQLSVSVDKVMQVPFESLGIRGTPTLMLVDNNGIVTDVWVGKLASGDEDAVMSRLQKVAATGASHNASSDAITAFIVNRGGSYAWIK